MGLFNFRKKEERADTVLSVDDVLLQALIGTSGATKEQVLSIPSVQSCIKFASDTVSMLPIKLYKEKDGKVQEVLNDPRIRLLNDDTGDTLDSVQFWRALITDYYIGKGGYAYINKQKNKIVSLHYVDESQISISKNVDPIFKDYDILVNAQMYKPYDFVKILRNTKDGAEGKSIANENGLIISLAYNSLVFEDNLVKMGGKKKGFLKSAKKMSQEAINALKAAFSNLYTNNTESVVVLNEGVEFQEAGNTSVEMQLNENKKSNASEICKLFNFPSSIIGGSATNQEYANAFKMGIMPLLRAIESALNRDLLLEREKTGEEVFYFAFDTKEMLKGDMKQRYDAYAVAIEKGFLNIDEVRYMEDKEPFGINWINLGLNSVLYDTETKEIYTPNTNQSQDMKKLQKGSEKVESRD